MASAARQLTNPPLIPRTNESQAAPHAPAPPATAHAWPRKPAQLTRPRNRHRGASLSQQAPHKQELSPTRLTVGQGAMPLLPLSLHLGLLSVIHRLNPRILRRAPRSSRSPRRRSRRSHRRLLRRPPRPDARWRRRLSLRRQRQQQAHQNQRPHASSCLPIGSARMRLPVAAKIALHSAGANGGTPGSPIPPGATAQSEGVMCVFVTTGASSIRTTG